jgi:hypothetical protein
VKTYALYLAACALHLVLLFLFSHLQLYRRHPLFMLWLLAAPLANLAFWVLYWAGEGRLLARAEVGLDVLEYALLIGALVLAVIQWHDPSSVVLRRGISALIIFALAGRLAANYQLAGGLGTVLANITNASFLAPIAYMLVKFSNVRLERLPLWLREDAPWVAVARHAYQFTHSLLS